MKAKKLLAVMTACTLTFSSAPTLTDVSAATTLKISNVSKSKKTMYVGKTFKIKTNIKASNLTFKSSNKKIAKVTKSGVIKAIKKGSCTITVTAKISSKKTVTKKFKLTVKNKKVTVTATPSVTTSPAVEATATPTTTTETASPSADVTTATTNPTTNTSTETVATATPAADTTSTATPTATPSAQTTTTSGTSVIGTVFVQKITFSENGVTLSDASGNTVAAKDASNLTVTDNTTVTIVAPTTSDQEIAVVGTCSNGQIVVNVDKTAYPKATVSLSLEGLTLSNNSAAPISITSIDDECEISVKKGTTNTLSSSYNDGSNTSSVIYSKDDLKIKGKGSLSIVSDYGYGILSKDTLKVYNGTITVKSYNACLKGKDKVKIGDDAQSSYDTLSLDLTSTYSDGIRSTNPIDDATKAATDDDYADGKSANVTINGGTIKINAYNDGIQSADTMIINGGTFDIYTYQGMNYSATTTNTTNQTNTTSQTTTSDTTTNNGFMPGDGNFGGMPGGNMGGMPSGNMGGNPGGMGMQEGNSTKTTFSCKALKSTGDMTINGGTFNIDSTDDAIHSNSNVTIAGGDFTIGSCDDGIHADKELTINNGNISITKSYEGLEAINITVNDGTVHVVSSDDGFNASDGTSNTNTNAYGPGGASFNQGSASTTASGTTPTLTINGGEILVEANGDGLDSNGSIYVTGGTTMVVGPTSGGNGILDIGDGNGYELSCTGGVLLGIGTSDMAVYPTTGNYISGTLSGSGSNTFAITDNSGNVISGLKYNLSLNNAMFVYYNGNISDYSNCKAYTSATLSNATDALGYTNSGTATGTEVTFSKNAGTTSNNGFPGGNYGGNPWGNF